jgi:hypothetical protein
MSSARDRAVHVRLDFFDNSNSGIEKHTNPAELVRSASGTIQVAEAYGYALYIGKPVESELQPALHVLANGFGDGKGS